MATIRDGGRAEWRIRNSQSSRVKMSFVTAAMEYLSRRALQRASMRAVFPEPTGLNDLVSWIVGRGVGEIELTRQFLL